MNLRFSLSAILALCLGNFCSAFLRTVQNISPLAFDYGKFIGAPNITSIITYNETGIKSYWFANFLSGDDGNDYCIVATSANAGTQQITSVSLLDITRGNYFGASYLRPGQLSNTKFDGQTDLLHVGAYSADQFSEIFAISSVPEAPFNLTYVPKGPNLYQAGSGAYIWGLGYAYAFDAPETYVTGTITVGGKIVNIVPEKSMTWFDMQWGPSYAPGGWHAFVVLLENGVKIQITVTNPAEKYNQNSLATFMFPDGHHEVYPVVNDVHPSNPFVSKISNITYYSNYRLDIPLKRASFDVTVPVPGGETALLTDPSPANTIADSFAYFTGTFDGVAVSGWGIAERRLSAGCGPFPC